MVAQTRDYEGSRRADPASQEVRAELREAYERGRRDARASRKRHPIAMTLLVIAAIVGGVMITLAFINGSFGGAGATVDKNLAVAADKAEPVVRDAASDARQAISTAGTDVRADTDGNPATGQPPR